MDLLQGQGRRREGVEDLEHPLVEHLEPAVERLRLDPSRAEHAGLDHERPGPRRVDHGVARHPQPRVDPEHAPGDRPSRCVLAPSAPTASPTSPSLGPPWTVIPASLNLPYPPGWAGPATALNRAMTFHDFYRGNVCDQIFADDSGRFLAGTPGTGLVEDSTPGGRNHFIRATGPNTGIDETSSSSPWRADDKRRAPMSSSLIQAAAFSRIRAGRAVQGQLGRSAGHEAGRLYSASARASRSRLNSGWNCDAHARSPPPEPPVAPLVVPSRASRPPGLVEPRS